ncbi:MAG TPA: hypothetical protein VLI92_01510 [Candidatus Saccharimonadales bacterium]|nr:hypothetical protein [Candidatus Saccharimonadales bacterium]
MNKLLLVLVGLAGVAFLVLAIIYFVTPAMNLPHFIPGYEVGVATTHFKHGLASLVLALGAGAFVWFKTGPSSNKQQDTTNQSS